MIALHLPALQGFFLLDLLVFVHILFYHPSLVYVSFHLCEKAA